MIVLYVFELVLRFTHASIVSALEIRKSATVLVDTVPWKLTGEPGTVVGTAAVLAAVPANNADPLVPPNGLFAVPL